MNLMIYSFAGYCRRGLYVMLRATALALRRLRLQFPNWNFQKRRNRLVVRTSKRFQPELDGFHVCLSCRTKQPVPYTEYAAVVRIRLRLMAAVMHPVPVGCGHQQARGALEPVREPYVAV